MGRDRGGNRGQSLLILIHQLSTMSVIGLPRRTVGENGYENAPDGDDGVPRGT